MPANTPIFGYGSLISPISLISKIRDTGNLSEVYDTAGKPYVTQAERTAWKKSREEIDRTPVKVRGYRRYYSKESVRGGAVLEAVRTGDQSDLINGILISNLTNEEYNKITATEPGYRIVELENPDIEFYHEADADRYADTTIQIFVREADPADLSISVQRNAIYHGRIVHGIQLLEEEYDESVASAFLDDFLQTTYELSHTATDQDEFVTVAMNDKYQNSSGKE